jgi:hypothetical protein
MLVTKELAFSELESLDQDDWSKHMIESIDALMPLRACNQARVHIQIILGIQRGPFEQDSFQNLLRMLHPAILRLRQAGLRMQVTLDDVLLFRRGTQSCERLQDTLRTWTEQLDGEMEVSRYSVRS